MEQALANTGSTLLGGMNKVQVQAAYFAGENMARVGGAAKVGGDVEGAGAGESRLKSIRVGNLNVMETKTPEVANNEWLAKGYDKPQYDPNFEVQIVQAGSNNYVRVFSYNADGTSNKLGGWIMLKSDIEGLTPAQIADRYALPQKPTHICDVILRLEYELQTGIANKVDGWGHGGGQQFDTIGKRLPISSFVNERMIGE